jgi:hypothetical protein
MHYADGTPAELNDEVRGKPYNTPYEVDGFVSRLTAGAATCNLVVEFAKLSAPGLFATPRPVLTFDYGQCDHFTLLRRAKAP